MKPNFSTFLLLFIILSNLLIFSLNAQNLVRNGSFEEIEQCPYNTSHFKYVKHWLDSGYYRYGGISSEELYHICGSNGYNIPNTVVGKRYARTGHSMASFSFYWISKPYGTNEIIQTELKNNLEKDKRYCVSYYVRPKSGMPSHGVCIQEFTATFTHDILMTGHGIPSDWWFPQIIHRNGIVKDTVNWTQITGNFIAEGGESYFTIGGYFPKDSVSKFFYHQNSAHATYFVDDVAVWDCSAPVYKADAGENQKVCAGDEVTLGTHDYPEYQYYWFKKGNLQDTLSAKARPVFQPQQTTEYLLEVIDFKYTKTYDSVTVEVDPDCMEFGKIPNVFTPNGDGINDTFKPQPMENIEYDIVIYNRWGKKIFTGDQDHLWDGTIEGQKAASGLYYYVISAVHTTSGASQEFSGDVTVLY